RGGVRGAPDVGPHPGLRPSLSQGGRGGGGEGDLCHDFYGGADGGEGPEPGGGAGGGGDAAGRGGGPGAVRIVVREVGSGAVVRAPRRVVQEDPVAGDLQRVGHAGRRVVELGAGPPWRDHGVGRVAAEHAEPARGRGQRRLAGGHGAAERWL